MNSATRKKLRRLRFWLYDIHFDSDKQKRKYTHLECSLSSVCWQKYCKEDSRTDIGYMDWFYGCSNLEVLGLGLSKNNNKF